jgi:hypothetical protein
MTEDEEPTGSLILGQFSLEYKDLPFREGVHNPIDQGIYRSRKSPHLFVYHAENDHWNCFVETFV